MWSGKQVISTILRAVIPPSKPLPSLKGKSNTAEKFWVTSTDHNPAIQTDDLMDSEVRNRPNCEQEPNLEIRFPDWLITSHVM